MKIVESILVWKKDATINAQSADQRRKMEIKMGPADAFLIVMCVVAGNFLTFLILAMSMPKKKEKDKKKDDNKGTERKSD